MRPRKSFACACGPHGCVASESLVNVKATALVNHGPWNSEALVRIVTLPRGHSSIKLPVLRGAPTEIGWDLFSPLDCKSRQRCRSTSTWTWTLVPGHPVPRAHESGVVSVRVHFCADVTSCNTVTIRRENRGVFGLMRESCTGLFCFGFLVVCGSEFIHNL